MEINKSFALGLLQGQDFTSRLKGIVLTSSWNSLVKIIYILHRRLQSVLLSPGKIRQGEVKTRAQGQSNTTQGTEERSLEFPLPRRNQCYYYFKRWWKEVGRKGEQKLQIPPLCTHLYYKSAIYIHIVVSCLVSSTLLYIKNSDLLVFIRQNYYSALERTSCQVLQFKNKENSSAKMQQMWLHKAKKTIIRSLPWKQPNYMCNAARSELRIWMCFAIV